MQKREDALREVLDKNEKEIQRWESYVKDNETAIENMNMFSKRLTVDVMVPVGRKAFIPGRLIHTNEVLMGHYQDYFSNCSAHTAIQICKRRIDNGKKHLEQLEVEKDLFQNKLEKPYLDGVLPSTEEREIIEEYDEDKERIWREEHRRNVKEAKQKEKEERQEQLSKENAHDELIQTLEEEEEDMINELDEELSELKIQPHDDTKELLSRLLSGEMTLPAPKKRIAHSTAEAKHVDSVQLKPIEAEANVLYVNPITDPISNPSASKLNHRTKLEMVADENDSDSSIASDTPEEIKRIEKQAEYLPHGDRMGFYQYQLQIVDQKIIGMTFRNNKELQEKMQLFKIRDYLEEIIEILEEAASIEIDTQTDDNEKDVEEQKHQSNVPKRKISFALEDQMLEFRKNETVAQMIPIDSPTEVRPQRDIVRLDEPMLIENQPQPESDSNKLVDRRKTILEKVEDNLKTQSLEDADLVTKIIDSSTNHVETLHIHFEHSTAVAAASSDNLETFIPSSPADLYRMVCGEEDHCPPANENEKESVSAKAYFDPRSEYLSPVSGESISTEPQSRSILKNKSAVERETHIVENKESAKPLRKKATKPKQEDEYLSAYNKVMSDVIENKPTVPDPLPEEKFVDMHTPKKRISRFKQMRIENN